MRSPLTAGFVAGLVVIAVVVAAAYVALPLVVPAWTVPSPPGPSPSLPAGAGGGSPAPSETAAPGGGPTSSTAPASAAVSSAAASGIGVGQAPPPLSLPLLGGGTLDLAAYRGRPVWVTFMASWCPACQDELPLMEAYRAQLGDQLPIVLVDVREDAATAAAFARTMKLDLPIALDRDGRAQRDWGAYALPIHYWIDGTGVIRAVAYGDLGPPQFTEKIRAVLPGASLKP